MPSFYTHASFGESVYKVLPEDVKKEIRLYKDLYATGLQGPDILFYYKALSKNKVNQTGFGQHDLPGRDFFQPALSRIEESKRKEESFSYIAGFICHYILDRQCHGYIDQVERKTGLSHAEIEVEVDRHLMERDGKDPLRFLASDSMISTTAHAEIIAQFFPDLSVKEVKKALESTKFYHRMLRAPGKIKRTFLYAGLKLIGKYEGMQGLVVNLKENPKCEKSTKDILALYEEGIFIARDYIVEYKETLKKQEKDLRGYDATFGV